MSHQYQILRIQQYLKGELSEAEMHRLEREALADPFLQDALDGYREAAAVDTRQLSLLQQRLASRIAGQQEKRNSFFFGVQRLAIGATAFVLFVTVCILYWMRTQTPVQPLDKEVEVVLHVADGVAIESLMGEGIDAVPQHGWDSYREYLITHVESGMTNESIVLSFDVNAHGVPVNVQYNQSQGEGVQEAIRLLTEGPRWNGSHGKVKMTFSAP